MDNPAKSLLDLLARERESLLRGDLSDLAARTVAKETAVHALARRATIDEAGPVLDTLRRNQALMRHAVEGLRAEIGRSDQRRAAASGFAAYDGHGALSRIGSTRRPTLASPRFASNASNPGQAD